MSTVIKLGSARHARIVMPYATSASAQPAVAVPPDTYQEELDRLHAMAARHAEVLADMRSEVEAARTEGEAAGRIAAELAAEDSRERALATLRQGIEQAQEVLTDSLEQMEVLALMIARAALEKLFGDDRGRRDAVSALVVRQLQSLDRQMLLKIEVSRLDFPDTRELAAFSTQIGIDEKLISADTDFPAGACRMRLRVGTLEVGLDQQWGAVRDLLDELAATTEARS